MADPDLDSLAGEFVLGTLDPAERLAFLRRLGREAEAGEAVVAWQQRLAPLALALDPVAPPPSLFPRIEAAIARDGRPIAANDDRATRWRAAALAAAMVAVVGIGAAIEQRIVRPPSVPIVASASPMVQPVGLTAIGALGPHGDVPVMFITYDRASGHVRIVPGSVNAVGAHSLELWLIEGKAAPRPLGLVDPRRAATMKVPSRIGADAVFAVSREPIGGSPTGLPTGPVLFTGSLVRI